MNNIKNKQILLIVPFFFGYHKAISDCLKQLSAEVTLVNADPSNSFMTFVGLSKKLGFGKEWLLRVFQNSIYSEINSKKYDFVLVICGWAITSYLCKLLRSNNLKHNGEMVLYYWDSLTLLNDDQSRWQYFDRIYTFDKDDYKSHNELFLFLPLFYMHSYEQINDKLSKDIDLFTAGSFKFNRYFEIELIKQLNPDISVYSYMYDSRWLIYFHKLIRPKYRDIKIEKLRFKKLSAEEIQLFYARSKAILDIPRAGQVGLTMRTFECLAMRKKMVTTNKNIKEYDFYDENNIFVLDEETHILPSKTWFESDYKQLDNSVLQKYSIDSWINTILGFESY